MPTNRGKLPFRGLEYPKREPFFAYKFIRLLAKTCAANQIGERGCWLLSMVAITEDTRRYSSPPTFYNCQLTAFMGTPSAQILMRTRQRCIDAGWLHYEAGTKSQAGVYWVTVPPEHELIPDGALGEDLTRAIQNMNSGSVSKMHIDPESKRNPSVIDPELKCAPSYPIPNPNPLPSKWESVFKKLREDCGLRTAADTLKKAIAAGHSLEHVDSIIDVYLRRRPLWNPGALRFRLIEPPGTNLPPEHGWFPPSPEEEQAALAEQRHAQGELRQREHAAGVAKSAADEQERAQRRDALRQLELQFGEQLDQLPADELEALVSDKPHLLPVLRRKGVRASIVRPELLRAFAERYATN